MLCFIIYLLCPLFSYSPLVLVLLFICLLSISPILHLLSYVLVLYGKDQSKSSKKSADFPKTANSFTFFADERKIS